jgi:hypothetical protein
MQAGQRKPSVSLFVHEIFLKGFFSSNAEGRKLF